MTGNDLLFIWGMNPNTNTENMNIFVGEKRREIANSQEFGT